MASEMPPAKSIWLSLIIIISYNANRWFTPPPIFTAHFSRALIPGVVFLVSKILVLVPCSKSTKKAVLVAMALMRCMAFNTKRSA